MIRKEVWKWWFSSPKLGDQRNQSQFTGSEKGGEKRGSVRAMQIDGGTMINGGCQREKIDRYNFTEKKTDTTRWVTHLV
jgi:hypothetical protein